MIWTRNLLIWSQTRYRCATESLVNVIDCVGHNEKDNKDITLSLIYKYDNNQSEIDSYLYKAYSRCPVNQDLMIPSSSP